AWLIAINQYTTFEDTLGRLLLKSEVCYAGSAYCLALAGFGTSGARNYLTEYLDYYLQQPQLWFDQSDALCALEYIDPSTAQRFLPKWEKFIADKPNWDLNRSREHFNANMNLIEEIRQIP
ncbi:MAG TPA: DUF6000 family protein, partial [Chitinophagaceae bacterium]|nr:DUF6000 family protein [Chitinophagaceae bacterium]